MGPGYDQQGHNPLCAGESALRDSNPQPPGCGPGALPVELKAVGPKPGSLGVLHHGGDVDREGVEPSASRVSGGRSTDELHVLELGAETKPRLENTGGQPVASLTLLANLRLYFPLAPPGGPTQIRTGCLRHAEAALYQVSYRPFTRPVFPRRPAWSATGYPVMDPRTGRGGAGSLSLCRLPCVTLRDSAGSRSQRDGRGSNSPCRSTWFTARVSHQTPPSHAWPGGVPTGALRSPNHRGEEDEGFEPPRLTPPGLANRSYRPLRQSSLSRVTSGRDHPS